MPKDQPSIKDDKLYEEQRERGAGAAREIGIEDARTSKKRTIANLPKSTRSELGKQAARGRSRGGEAGHALEDRKPAAALRDREGPRHPRTVQDGRVAAHRRDPQVPLTSDTGAARAPRSRLDPAVFRLSLEKIRSGYYTDAYFNHAKALLEPRKSARPMTTARLAMIRGVRAVVTIYALVIVAGLGLYVIVGLTHG